MMLADDLLVSVRSRKLPCVLDPALVLGSPHGLEFALRLTQVTEPWLTRAFWQLIDASDLVMPKLVAPDRGDALQPRGDMLDAWIALRERTDAGSWPFRWVGDRLAESQLKERADEGLMLRHDAIAESLALRLGEDGAEHGRGWPPGWDPLSASLDTIALSTALDAAAVITAVVEDDEPWPVRALRRLRVPITRLDPLPPESLFATERALLRDALAAAGLAPLVQRLPALVVLHVMAGGGAGPARELADEFTSGDEGAVDASRWPSADAWHEARAWWYRL